MRLHTRTQTALVLGATLIAAGPAAAQYYPTGGWYRSAPAGYTVRAWGLYGGPVVPPGLGTYEAYYPGRPILTVTDPWGRVADVPLRPKLLYYSDQILTPQGSFYPTSVVVIPDDRRPRSAVASSRVYAPPAPVVREGSLPPGTQPPAAIQEPPLPPPTPLPDREPKPITGEPPKPKAAAPDRPGDSVGPAVPALPKLPDVPPAPDRPKPAGSKLPNLGPSPMDAVLPPRPAK